MLGKDALNELRDLRQEINRLQALRLRRNFLVARACSQFSEAQVARAAGLSKSQVHRICDSLGNES